MTEILTGIGWLLRIFIDITDGYGLIPLGLVLLVFLAVVTWSVRTVAGVFGRLFGIREFSLRDWKLTHPAGWLWLRATSAAFGLVSGLWMLAQRPGIGLPLLLTVCSAGWLTIRAADFLSGYRLDRAGLVAAAQTAVTKLALDLVWQSIGLVTVVRGRLRVPRYEGWEIARMNDGWAYGLHCNGFQVPQGGMSIGQVMELSASPGSVFDTITSNLNGVLSDPSELRGPLSVALRLSGLMPRYAGTLVDVPAGYPAGTARLTLLLRIPLERVRPYPWRPGFWAGRHAEAAAAHATAARADIERLATATSAKAQTLRDAAIARAANPDGWAIRDLLDAGIPVGFVTDGALVRLDLTDEHVCLMGQTRTGKSTLLECLLHVLVELPASHVRLAILDLKGGAHLAGYRDRASIFAATPEEAEAALQHIHTQVVRPRFDHLRANGLQKIEVVDPTTPMWFIVIDEAWRLTPEAMDLCADIAKEGAAGQVKIIFSTQYMRQEDGMPRALDVNLGIRLATRLSDSPASHKAMTRAGISPNCAPHLIRKSKTTRGVFCCSLGGTDPFYAKSFLTGGIADQRRRTHAGVARWGAPPLVQLAPPDPDERDATQPERVVELDADRPWDDDRETVWQEALAELCSFAGPGIPPGQVQDRADLQAVLRHARRCHNPARMPAGPERVEVTGRRNRVETLARQLMAELPARETARRAPVAVG